MKTKNFELKIEAEDLSANKIHRALLWNSSNADSKILTWEKTIFVFIVQQVGLSEKF